MIEDDHGRNLSIQIARKLLVFLRRPGGQSQFSAHLAAQIATEDRIQELQHWILDHVDEDLTLNALGNRVGMSVRNLSRVFLKETGETPADFVEQARVDAARRLLEENDLPLQRIASHSGFSNPDIIRRAFMRRIHISPNEYRKRFRA
nr:helix-turn-helix domain-containing protein [Agarilytica rhodophyticola]